MHYDGHNKLLQNEIKEMLVCFSKLVSKIPFPMDIQSHFLQGGIKKIKKCFATK